MARTLRRRRRRSHRGGEAAGQNAPPRVPGSDIGFVRVSYDLENRRNIDQLRGFPVAVAAGHARGRGGAGRGGHQDRSVAGPPSRRVVAAPGGLGLGVRERREPRRLGRASG